jgi:hypothetical protein
MAKKETVTDGLSSGIEVVEAATSSPKAFKRLGVIFQGENLGLSRAVVDFAEFGGMALGDSKGLPPDEVAFAGEKPGVPPPATA